MLTTVGIALWVCYAMWSIGSLHRFIWFVVVFLSAVNIGCYIGNDDAGDWIDKYELRWFGKYGSQMIKRQRALVVWRLGIRILLGGALLGALGYGIALLFGWTPYFWEIYLILGALPIGIIWLILRLCAFFVNDGKKAREITYRTMMWIIIAVVCLAAFGTILYYLIPLIAAGR